MKCVQRGERRNLTRYHPSNFNSIKMLLIATESKEKVRWTYEHDMNWSSRTCEGSVAQRQTNVPLCLEFS